MKQVSLITRQLSTAQERKAATMPQTGALEAKLRTDERNARRDSSLFTSKTAYRVYFEDRYDTNGVADIVARYFEGATIFRDAYGLDSRAIGGREPSVVVEIVSSKPDALQRVIDLAGDIRARYHQVSVLVTRQTVDTTEVVDPETRVFSVQGSDHEQV